MFHNNPDNNVVKLFDINNSVSIVKKLRRGKNVDNPVNYPKNETVNPQNIFPNDFILRGPHEQNISVNNISLNDGQEKINIINPNLTCQKFL